MDAAPVIDTDEETLTLADIYADMGKNPDPTGDYAAGRTQFFANSEEFLASLEAISSESD